MMSWLDALKEYVALGASLAAVLGALFAIARDWTKTRSDVATATISATRDMVAMLEEMRGTESDDHETFRRVTLDAYVTAMKTIADLQGTTKTLQTDIQETSKQLNSVTTQLTLITLERDEYRRQFENERAARVVLEARLENETAQRENLARLLSQEQGERYRLERELTIARSEIEQLRDSMSRFNNNNKQGDEHGS